jgi:hypothetical protein
MIANRAWMKRDLGFGPCSMPPPASTFATTAAATGDAVLGYVQKNMASPPAWLAVGNVSVPQIQSEGAMKQRATAAAQIYKSFERWSTVYSPITRAAIIAAL